MFFIFYYIFCVIIELYEIIIFFSNKNYIHLPAVIDTETTRLQSIELKSIVSEMKEDRNEDKRTGRKIY